MKGLILVQSKYGASEKYAKWLSEKMNYPMELAKEVRTVDFDGMDQVIHFGGLYASGIAGVNVLKKHWEMLRRKQISIFAVGASPYSQEIIDKLREKHCKNEFEKCELFYGRGTWNLEKMSFIDRNICKLLQRSVAKKSPSELEIWEKALLEASNGPEDWTNPKFLEPLIKHLKGESYEQ